MIIEFKKWAKEFLFELSILSVIGAGFFLIFIIWSRAASAEPIEQVYYFYEDDRYFARLSWTPETYHDGSINLEDLGTIKAEIGIWLN